LVEVIEVEVKLCPTVKHMTDRMLLEKLIIALADHPQVSHYLMKHGLVESVTGR